ncbi:MAG: hypothetical protein ACYSUK_05260 [Planctomycetota bacterium]|jgi:ABC-type spermidine/putrescine transport system permease subunit II
MKKTRTVIIVLAVALGAITGLLWLRFGDHFIEPIFGQSVTWFVLPEIISLILSLTLFFAQFKQKIKNRIVNSILFLILFYIFFWAPLACFIAYMVLTGSTM